MPDVVVTGRRIPQPTYDVPPSSQIYEFISAISVTSEHPPELISGEDGTPSTDPGETTPRVANADDFEWPPGFQLALYAMQASLTAIANAIANHPVPASMQTPNGKPFDYTGFYNHLMYYDILITRYDTLGMLMGSSTSGGEVISTNAGWISRMLPSTLMGYYQRGQASLNYVILHEIAHTTNESVAATAEQFRSYLTEKQRIEALGGTAPSWEQSEMFRQSERFANGIAKSVADETGIAFPPDNQIPVGYPSTWP